MNINEEIKSRLFELQDLKFREFHCKLIPNVDPETVIGVRTPALRSLAKEMAKREDVDEFLSVLPHRYYDENQLHTFILSGIKDFGKAMDYVNRFLPFVNNWATCDQLSPKIFGKTRENKKRLLQQIKIWLTGKVSLDALKNESANPCRSEPFPLSHNEPIPSCRSESFSPSHCEPLSPCHCERSEAIQNSEKIHVYAIRFGIEMLMTFFLDEDFKPEYLKIVSKIRSKEYYINMMIAWYFATALAKQYDSTLPFIQKQTLDNWTHNKTIQKAIESYRITDEQKAYLRTLKV